MLFIQFLLCLCVAFAAHRGLNELMLHTNCVYAYPVELKKYFHACQMCAQSRSFSLRIFENIFSPAIITTWWCHTFCMFVCSSVFMLCALCTHFAWMHSYFFWGGLRGFAVVCCNFYKHWAGKVQLEWFSLKKLFSCLYTHTTLSPFWYFW